MILDLSPYDSQYPSQIAIFDDFYSFVHVALGVLAAHLPQSEAIALSLGFGGYQLESFTTISGDLMEYAIGLAVGGMYAGHQH